MKTCLGSVRVTLWSLNVQSQKGRLSRYRSVLSILSMCAHCVSFAFCHRDNRLFKGDFESFLKSILPEDREIAQQALTPA